MSKAATVYDVADRAGVSIATVSRALSGSTGAVGEVGHVERGALGRHVVRIALT